MKIELKHLAPYLPYGLKGVSKEQYFGIETVIGYSTYGKEDIELTTNIDAIIIEEFKPILRPLSDLTKEIEHNGEKFVPIFKLWELAGFEIGRGQYVEESPNYAETSNLGTAQVFRISKYDILSSNYNVVDKLFEWHFDVFGLIEQGLAIDINTIS